MRTHAEGAGDELERRGIAHLGRDQVGQDLDRVRGQLLAALDRQRLEPAELDLQLLLGRLLDGRPYAVEELSRHLPARLVHRVSFVAGQMLAV